MMACLGIYYAFRRDRIELGGLSTLPPWATAIISPRGIEVWWSLYKSLALANASEQNAPRSYLPTGIRYIQSMSFPGSERVALILLLSPTYRQRQGAYYEHTTAESCHEHL